MTAWRQPRTLAEFGGLDALKPAERKLLEERDTGLPVVLGDGSLPPADAPEDRRVRASFLRWLILGAEGAEGRTHEKGVRVAGAFIESDGPEWAAQRGLDLEGCAVEHDLWLFECRFEDGPILRSSRLASLYLIGGQTPGISADRMEMRGGFFVRDGFACNGEISLLDARIDGQVNISGAILRNSGAIALDADGLTVTGDLLLARGVECDGKISLVGARIGGDIDCAQTRLRNTGGRALDASRAVVTGTVSLRDDFECKGAISLAGAWVGRDLLCAGARLLNHHSVALYASRLETSGSVFFLDGFESQGEIRLHNARIGGSMSLIDAGVYNEGGTAFMARAARVSGSLTLHHEAVIVGSFDLRDAEVERLDDAPNVWPASIRLDQLDYKAFTGRAWTAVERIAWLDRQAPEDGFRPQPWEQCAKVLRESGHAEDARAVLIAKERRQRRARRGRASRWLRPWMLVWDGLLGLTVRYGRQPMRAFAWLAGFWLVGAVMFAWVWGQGGMMPSSVFLARGEEWVRCGAEVGATVELSETGSAGKSRLADGLRAPGATQLDCFLDRKEAGSLPPFSPLVYSLDALLPVVMLHQEESWTPNADTAAGWWGLRYLWTQIIAGWLLSLLAIAGFSGLVKSD